MGKKQYPDTSPVLTFIMSLFMPSSGQLYNKQPIKAIAALLLFLLAILALPYVSWLLWLIWIAIVTDATAVSIHYRNQRRKKLKAFF